MNGSRNLSLEILRAGSQSSGNRWLVVLENTEILDIVGEHRVRIKSVRELRDVELEGA